VSIGEEHDAAAILLQKDAWGRIQVLQCRRIESKLKGRIDNARLR
jgi:hypothetical protein